MAALIKLGNRQVRPTIFAIMGAMPIQDRDNLKKIEKEIRLKGYRAPTLVTLKKNQKEFLATQKTSSIPSPTSNGNISGLNLDDHISLHDLAELASHKDLIQRIGPEKIEKIMQTW